MTLIPVSLAVEGDLDEQVLRRLLEQSGKPFDPGVCYGRHGKDHLRKNIAHFNHAARYTPFIILADLDNEDCPPGLVSRWLPKGRNSNLVLRIAVHKVEAWLMADREHLAEFLAIPVAKISQQPDNYDNPKLSLVNLARLSRKPSLREDLVPVLGSTSQVGRNYTGQLIRFIVNEWRVDDAARRHSPSLDRAMNAVQRFMLVLLE